MKTLSFKFIVICWLILSTYGCRKILFPSEKLTIQPTPYTGNQLRIDGYYFTETVSGSDYAPSYQIYFLYRNGVIFGGDNALLSELSTREAEFMNGVYYADSKDVRYCWGRFIIVDNSIVYEKWYPGADSWVYKSQGEILNDSTFHISSSRHGEDEFSPENDLFHFKKLSPKPDSTNEFTN